MNYQLKIYNITSFGANIKGAENTNLNEVMANLEIPFDKLTTEDIISKTLYNSKYNPVELKKQAKEIVDKEKQINYDIETNITSILEKNSEDDMFYVSAYNILNKISSTIFLSQILQFEMLKCTKSITQLNNVQKRASFELFLEDTVKVINQLNKKLSEV